MSHTCTCGGHGGCGGGGEEREAEVAALFPEPPPDHPYVLLGTLLEYARPDAAAVAQEARALLAPRSAEAASHVEAFGTYAASVSAEALSELYARTFDFNPSHALELGYQLFGESYKRGVFLVKMQARVKAFGIAFEPELPDHLSVVLKLLAAVQAEEARAIADEVVLPALEKVLGHFSDETEPYRLVLLATRALLCADFQITEVKPAPEERSYLLPGMQSDRPTPPPADARAEPLPAAGGSR